MAKVCIQARSATADEMWDLARDQHQVLMFIVEGLTASLKRHGVDDLSEVEWEVRRDTGIRIVNATVLVDA